MNESIVQSTKHSSIRRVLRMGGPIVALAGFGFVVVGFGSFFMSFGGSVLPRYFWCAFVGIPLLFVGAVMCMFGYIGAYYRYVAGESVPVAKDVVNYMGENVQPGVKAMAKAVTEGIMEGQKQDGDKR
jgi:hypothetical protein